MAYCLKALASEHGFMVKASLEEITPSKFTLQHMISFILLIHPSFPAIECDNDASGYI